MKRIKYIMSVVALCGLMIFAAACSKNQPALPTFAKSDVPPLHAGNWWRYLVTDSISSTTDTLTLSISSTALSGTTLTARCYISKAGSIVDSSYFVLSDTAVYYQPYAPAQGLLASYKLKLPFTTGGSWSYVTAGDNYTVRSYQISADILGTIYTAFDLNRNTVIPDNTTVQHLEVAKGVGVVFQEYSFDGFAGVTQHFSAQLIDYQLN